jgi:tetratricopeptide (TPR) repeat protein
MERQKRPLDEVLRQLREEDPPRPSVRLGTEKESSAAAAEKRGAQPRQLMRLLRRDLDWITMKALERDRARRYGTPSDLAADIGRYLHNEPVVARPASTVYRAQKYVRRHRLGVAIAAGLLLLLVAFSAMQAVQVIRVARERDRGDRITEFMTGMFKVVDPSEARGNTVTAREILDKASKDIDTGLAQDPQLRAQMLDVMGTVYGNLGLYSRAQSLLQRDVDIRRQVLGPEHANTLDSMNKLARTLADEGRFPEAQRLYQELLAIRRRVLGPEHPDTLVLMNGLATILNK